MSKKLPMVLAVAVLMVGTASVGAKTTASSSTTTQSHTSSKHEPLQRIRAALEQLDLTPQQKEKFKSIFTQTRSELKAAKAQSHAKGEVHQIIEKARQQIMAVLDNEQKAKLKEILRNEKGGKSQTA
ncbi:MAG: hypothetical protein JO353_12350 [Phycisphaerae bacterium]|nr:hypothetical protein [Phycisphaerae bacterium]